MNDMLIDECHKYFTHDPTDHSDAIVVQDHEISPKEFTFPLCMIEVTSVIDVRKPTTTEYNELPHLI